MKIGIVYTSTTPELIETVNAELKKQLGEDVEFLNYEDPSILAEVRDAEFVTAGAAARLVTMFMQAVQDKAEVVLNCCSSVGEVADAAVSIGKFTGVEEMCREAVRLGKRIGVLATLPTTLEPTKHTIVRVSRELGKQVTLVDGLVEGAFGVDQEQFKALLGKTAEQIRDQADVILLSQGSMAYAETFLSETYGIPVVSSPRFGAASCSRCLKARRSAMYWKISGSVQEKQKVILTGQYLETEIFINGWKQPFILPLKITMRRCWNRSMRIWN